MKAKIFVITAIFVLFAVGNSNANLITNGGFETGDLTGWTASGADVAHATSFVTPYAGTYTFEGVDNSGYATLSQTISTALGSSYDFSFFWKVYQISGNQLGYSFSGYGNAAFVTPSLPLNWTQTTGSFVATGSSTTIEFYFATDPGTGAWWIDDVSVSPVPEPATMLLLGLGLVGLAGVRRFRK